MAAGQMVIPVANGEVRVHPMTNPDGGYSRGKAVTLGAYPETAGSEIFWSGVDTDRDAIATLKMDRDREVVVVLNPGLAQPAPIALPSDYASINMYCAPITSHIAEFVLENVYKYNQTAAGGAPRQLGIFGVGGAGCKGGPEPVDWNRFNEAFRVGQLNLDLGLPTEGIDGIEELIFGGRFGKVAYSSPRDIQEQHDGDTFNVMGHVADGVVKVGSPGANFPRFLYEMRFSENTLTALHGSGLVEEGLARHYFKNYEDEWKIWFKDEESWRVEELKTAAAGPFSPNR